MVPAVEPGSGVCLEEGRYRFILSGYGEAIVVVPNERLPVCRSCHRELADIDDIANVEPFICVRCYSS